MAQLSRAAAGCGRAEEGRRRRRKFLASATAFGGRMAAAQNPHLSSGSENPKRKAPAGCTDCHHYLDDPRYPPVPVRVAHPEKATADDYRQLIQRLGIARQVIVQPSAYGTDNRLLLDGLNMVGAQARGIAVATPDIGDAELKHLDALGVRGLRFSFAPSRRSPKR
jgi:D-galactarolactone isomerase